MTEVVVVTTGTLEDVEIICNKLLSDHHRYHINTQVFYMLHDFPMA